MAALDLRGLNATQASNVTSAVSGAGAIGLGYLSDSADIKPSGFNELVTERLTTLPYTRQQFEEAANQGKYPGQE